MRILLSVALILGCWCGAQDLPEGPKPQANCGPKWAGGCYSQRNQRTWRETFDRKWKYSTAAFLTATAFDYAMSVRGTDRKLPTGQPACIENNENLGLNPGAGDVARDFAETHLPVIIIGTMIHKAAGRSKWASWIYPGMMAYGTQMHIRSGVSWFRCQ